MGDRFNNKSISRKFVQTTIFVFFVAFLVFMPMSAVFSQVMESTNYQVQLDSVNVGGGNSASASFILENTTGEVGTGLLAGLLNKIFAGFQQSDVVADTPSGGGDEDGGGTTSGGRPDDPMPSVTNFVAIPSNTVINLSWNNPEHQDFNLVRIVRSTTFFPEFPSDGVLIYGGVGESLVDSNVIAEVTYYYAAFAVDAEGDYVAPAITIARLGESVPTPPFEDFPDAPDEIKDLLDLSLADLEFIQDGKSLPLIGTAAFIDGDIPLSVRIAYDKLPEVLKTIGVTLTHPDGERSFSFLLRVNEDKTAYIATLAPLVESGTYDVLVTALDIERQKLQTLKTKLVISDTVAAVGGFANAVISLIAVLILILIILWRVLRRKKKRLYA